MPDVKDLLEKSKKKFVRSGYRPWNYMEEIEKEERPKFEEDRNVSIIEKKPYSIIQESENNKESALDIFNSNENLGVIKARIFKNNNVIHYNGSFLDKIFRLTGHQKTLFLFIIERCLSRGLLTTGAITGDTLLKVVKTSLKMIKIIIQRLVFKDLIIREKGKAGRGGFYCFSVHESIRNAAIEYKKLATNDLYEGVIQKSNSNHAEINNTISDNFENPMTSRLPKEWQMIDFEALKNIGFTAGHLAQIYRLSTKENWFDAKMVQNFIHYYAYDLEYNKKIDEIKKTTPIGYFMGTLEKKGVYNSPPNYESPRDRNLRLYYENEKILEEKAKKVENKLFDMAFNKWEKELSEEKRKSIIPQDTYHGRFKGAAMACLRSFFSENIWPNIKTKIIESEIGYN